MRLELDSDYVKKLMWRNRVTYGELAARIGLESYQAAFQSIRNKSTKYVELMAPVLGIKDPRRLVKIVKENGGGND